MGGLERSFACWAYIYLTVFENLSVELFKTKNDSTFHGVTKK